MNAHVRLKVALSRECPATDFTFKRPFAGMGSGVDFQMSASCKSGAARLAPVRLLTGMNPNMYS